MLIAAIHLCRVPVAGQMWRLGSRPLGPTDRPPPLDLEMNTGTSFDPKEPADDDIFWIDVDPSAPSEDSAGITTRQMCERFKLPARTLRFYASKGLLAPTRSGRERLYGPLDQRHLALILKGRRLGFTLDEIAQMIALREGGGPASVRSALQQKCFDRIQQLESRMQKLAENLAELRFLHASL
jgi:DNA-binding transcriptional MerR regulator